MRKSRKTGKRPGTSDLLPPIVRIADLEFSYKTRQALNRLSLTVRERELFGILGPNGSGKSTLFKVLSTLMLPGAGEVEIAGRSVITDPAEVRRRIGVVFQSPGLDVKLTVLENLRAQGALYGMSGDLLAERIDLGLKQLRLEDRRHEIVESLSGGLQRRVELARGMLHAPQLLLLDEPTAGLDPRARIDFWRFLEQIRRRFHLTVIVTTHLTHEAEHCDRIAILDGGALVTLGNPAEMIEEIGGEIIVVTSDNPEQLQKAIRRRFKVPAQLVDGELRMKLRNAARVVPKLSRAFGPMIGSVTIRRPSLEDVFLHATGHMFDQTPQSAELGP